MLEYYSSAAPYSSVFVHGAGGNGLLWKRTLRNLSGDASAVAVNLPGHPSGDITCTTVAQYSDALFGFMQEAGISRPVLVGHSMGTAVSLTLAATHPEALGGLVLVSGGAKLGVDPYILQSLRGDPLRAIEDVITPQSFYSVDLGLGREARAALSIPNLPVFLNDYLACAAFDARQDLEKIRARTLIVCGDMDRMTPPKWAHYLQSNMDDSELYFIKDAGHMLPIEKPDALGALLMSFLKGFSR